MATSSERAKALARRLKLTHTLKAPWGGIAQCNHPETWCDACAGIEAIEQALAEAEARIAALEAALREVLALIDGGWLVRNMTNDAHFPSYLAEATRLVKVLSMAQGLIDESTPTPAAR